MYIDKIGEHVIIITYHENTKANDDRLSDNRI